jgi:hypothetical protein
LRWKIFGDISSFLVPLLVYHHVRLAVVLAACNIARQFRGSFAQQSYL